MQQLAKSAKHQSIWRCCRLSFANSASFTWLLSLLLLLLDSRSLGRLTGFTQQNGAIWKAVRRGQRKVAINLTTDSFTFLSFAYYSQDSPLESFSLRRRRLNHHLPLPIHRNRFVCQAYHDYLSDIMMISIIAFIIIIVVAGICINSYTCPMMMMIVWIACMELLYWP